MVEELVKFETAKLAKEIGFLWETQYNYDLLKEIHHVGIQNHNSNPKKYSAPTQSLLQRWLREVHKIHIELLIDGTYKSGSDENIVHDDYLCYRAFIWKVGELRPGPADDLGASDYEVILEIALRDALNMIK